MKKVFSLFAVAIVAVAMQAQTLRIGNNDSSMDKAPVYTTWADKYYCSQIIYSASDLVDMKGKDITKLAFFLREVTGNGKDYNNVEIRLMSVSHTTFSETTYDPIDDAVLVFSGTLPASTQTELEVTLEDPYFYEKGHLLVDVRKTVTGGGYAQSGKGRFQATYGETNYTVLYGYSPSALPTSGTQSGNRPDIRFTYQDHVEATCAKPGKPEITYLDATSASFEWTAGGAETQWQIVLAKGEDAADWGQAQLVSEHQTAFTVEPSTDYTCYVRAYCSEADQSEAASLAFKTPCAPLATLPYEEGFEDDENSKLGCWTNYATADGYPMVSTYESLAHGGANYLFFKGGMDGTKQITVLPALNTQLNQLQISFWLNHGFYYSYESAATLEIGYMTNVNDSASFVPVKAADKYQDYTKVECSFAEVPGEAQYIALRFANGSYNVNCYVDDLKVEVITEPTDIKSVKNEKSATKFVRNGQLVIEKNGQFFNAQGAQIQ